MYGIDKIGFIFNTLLSAGRDLTPETQDKLAPLAVLSHPMLFDNLNIGDSPKPDEPHDALHSSFLPRLN